MQRELKNPVRNQSANLHTLVPGVSCVLRSLFSVSRRKLTDLERFDCFVLLTAPPCAAKAAIPPADVPFAAGRLEN